MQSHIQIMFLMLDGKIHLKAVNVKLVVMENIRAPRWAPYPCEIYPKTPEPAIYL